MKISKTKTEVSYCCSYLMWQLSLKLRQAWQRCCNSSKVRLMGQWPGWPAGKTREEMASSRWSPCLLQQYSMNRHLCINNFQQNTFGETAVLPNLQGWLHLKGWHKRVIFQRSSALCQFYQSGQYYLCMLSWRTGEPLLNTEHQKQKN